jgi:hypothetical protein
MTGSDQTRTNKHVCGGGCFFRKQPCRPFCHDNDNPRREAVPMELQWMTDATVGSSLRDRQHDGLIPPFNRSRANGQDI